MNGSREERVKELFLKHLEIVGKCIEKLKEAVIYHFEGDLDKFNEAWRELDELEDKADDIRRQIEIDLYKGAFLPIYRADLFSIIESVDRIANQAEYVSDVFKYVKPRVLHRECMIKLIDSVIETFKVFEKCMKIVFKDPERSIPCCREVRETRKKTEEIAERNLEHIFKGGRILSLMEFLEAYVLQNLINQITRISSLIEDASDRVLKMIGILPV